MIPIHLVAKTKDTFGEVRRFRRTANPGWYLDGIQMVLLGDAGETIVDAAAPVAMTVSSFGKWIAATNRVTEDAGLRIEPVEGESVAAVCPSCNGSGDGTCPNCDQSCACQCNRCHGTGDIEKIIKPTVHGRIVYVGGDVRVVLNPAFAPMLAACDEVRCDNPNEAAVGYMGGVPVAIVMPMMDREINPVGGMR